MSCLCFVKLIGVIAIVVQVFIWIAITVAILSEEVEEGQFQFDLDNYSPKAFITLCYIPFGYLGFLFDYLGRAGKAFGKNIKKYFTED